MHELRRNCRWISMHWSMRADLCGELAHGGLIPDWNVVLHLLHTVVLEFYCSKCGLFPDLCVNYSPSMVLKNSSVDLQRLLLSAWRNIQLLFRIGNYTPPQGTFATPMWGLWGLSRTKITSWSSGHHISALPLGQMVKVRVSICETYSAQTRTSQLSAVRLL